MAAGKLTYQQRAQRKDRRRALLTVAGVAFVGLVIVNAVTRSPPVRAGVGGMPIAADHEPAPNEDNFEGKLAADHNRDIYGHPWPQTEKEKAADASWQAVKDQESAGADENYKTYNARLTATYQAWERLERLAYGPNWKSLWRSRNAGDVLGECGSLQALGMSHSECVSMELSKGDIEPLEPMLMKCAPGGSIMPRDAISCRTHGRQSEYSVRRDAIAAGSRSARTLCRTEADRQFATEKHQRVHSGQLKSRRVKVSFPKGAKRFSTARGYAKWSTESLE